MIKRVFAYLAVLLALLCCTSSLERETGGMDPSLEGKPVTVTFSVPAARLASGTKGIEDDEGLISASPYLDPDKLFLVVCGHSQSIKYIRKAEVVLDSNLQPVTEEVPVADIPGYPLTDGVSVVTVYKFQVQLELSDSDRTIHFLGNIDEDQLSTGSYSYQILPTLVSYPGKQAYWQKVYLEHILPKLDANNQPIVQNGSYLPNEELEESLSYIPLIRNYAEIQVTNETAEGDGFELFSYAVIYYPKNGSVVPYRSNAGQNEDPFSFGAAGDYRFSGYEQCDFPKLDEDLGYLGNMPPKVEIDRVIPSADMFEHPENSGGAVVKYDANNPDQGFYIYERTIPGDNLEPTFVIIRGRFGDGEDFYYYRLDLMEPKVVEHETVYQYYPIYRNFKYIIRLNRISSVGVDTPQLAAVSSSATDISADISMRHLGDISNGQTRLVVEPFMARTYTGPNEEGYYYLYARFFNDVNSPDPNTDWGAVSAELIPMGDMSEDILTLYDDVGNDVQAFYPSAQEMGGEPGFRIIRFNTHAPGTETKTQKIRITGRNLYTHEEFPLYRDVEITLQKKQSLSVSCSHPDLPMQKNAQQEIKITIPAGLPSSMFPLEFIIEAELPTLTPDNKVEGNNLPVVSGPSISDNEGFRGKNTIQFVRTLTWDEYTGLANEEGYCTFSSYFKSNRPRSATTVWVSNDYFTKGFVSFENMDEVTGHFWVKINEDAETNCLVALNNNNLEYNIDDTGWKPYTKNKGIELERGHKVAFRSTAQVTAWNNGLFNCYKKGSGSTAKDGQFSVGGNIASLIMGDSFVSEAESFNTSYSFLDFFKGHVNLTDASELVLPMLTCYTSSYKSFFDGCTNLRKGPKELPATTLGNTCYRNMFLNCAALEEAPYIAAENPASGCFQRMFVGCTSLRLIKLNCKEYRSGDFKNGNEEIWYNGVPTDGEIWLNTAIRNSSGFINVIPKGNGWQWVVKTLPDGELWQ